MLIQRTDPRFWDVRLFERRLRRGELTRAEIDAHLLTLPDTTEKATVSLPLDEPDDRPRRRLAAKKAATPLQALRASIDLDDDDDDLLDDDDDEDLDDEDDDLDDDAV
jgi:hypothetical protein